MEGLRKSAFAEEIKNFKANLDERAEFMLRRGHRLAKIQSDYQKNLHDGEQKENLSTEHLQGLIQREESLEAKIRILKHNLLILQKMI